MKLAVVLLVAMLAASIAAQVPTKASFVDNCMNDIQGSVTAIKAIQTDLYHLAKYWDLIKQFVQLKNYLIDGRLSCSKVTPEDLKSWLATHQPSDVVRCAIDIYFLVVDTKLLGMDLDEKKYLAAVRDLKDLVVQANKVKTDCSKVVFLAWK